MFKPSPNILFAGKLPDAALRNHEMTQVTLPLSELVPNRPARVTEITFALATRLQQLSAFGLAPGCELRVRQRHPAVVVEIGHTTLALDLEVAREILVEPV